MAHEKLRPQYFFDESKIEKLKQIAPECFEDGKINFETLKENLGDWTQNEEDPELEHFGLFWPGKRNARRAAALPPEGTLEPVWGSGLKADGTVDTEGLNDSKNVFIEGENLEVLKLLQKSYSEKIKLIYIDPPYNTGSDFVYDDDFTEPVQEYLRRTGQVDEEGKALTTNKRSDGRFHSKWLSMMYPRLRLARNLLREDGVIMISIDEHEQHNLKQVLIEIFGEENYLGEFIWKNKHGGGGDSPFIVKEHEFVLIFAKNLSVLPELFSEPHPDYEKMFREKDEKGPFYFDRLDKKGIDQNRPNLIYPIECPDGSMKDISPAIWRLSKEEFARRKENNEIGFKKDKNDEWQIYTKTYLFDENGEKRRVKARSILKQEIVGFTQNGNKEIVDLFGKKYFENPKPTELICFLIDLITHNDDEAIILDFFGGSGTTAHSVLKDNMKYKKNKKFILVQIPDQVESNSIPFKEGFKSIAQITAQRIRLSSKQVKEASETVLKDVGFKYLRLVHSNYKPWKNYQGTSVQQLQIELEQYNTSPLREGYTNDALFTEIKLMEGFTICSTEELISEIKFNSIKKISSEYCDHNLLVCLDSNISKETISNLTLGDDDVFICLDSAISTEDKLRLSDKGLIKTI